MSIQASDPIRGPARGDAATAIAALDGPDAKDKAWSRGQVVSDQYLADPHSRHVQDCRDTTLRDSDFMQVNNPLLDLRRDDRNDANGLRRRYRVCVDSASPVEHETTRIFPTNPKSRRDLSRMHPQRCRITDGGDFIIRQVSVTEPVHRRRQAFKVLWANTLPVTAVVMYLPPGGNRPDHLLVRKPMSINRAPHYPRLPISPRRGATGPHPTAGLGIDAIRKGDFGGTITRHWMTPLPSLKVPRPGRCQSRPGFVVSSILAQIPHEHAENRGVVWAA